VKKRKKKKKKKEKEEEEVVQFLPHRKYAVPPLHKPAS
jgi:hypothetical protein